ncbi:MAG: hypothetical protein HYX75_09800 [Acidobacteria bacterium]|nr:hypothetical protein [Acidobacteriota bacterium]
MREKISAGELVRLVQRVFEPRGDDRRLAILVDLPDEAVPDHPAWRARREMAAEWAGMLTSHTSDVGIDSVNLVLYRNVRANNADLPASAVIHRGASLPVTADEVHGEAIELDHVFRTHQILIALTEFSATAPLKVAARTHMLRAATMPGFSQEMIPALRLDYARIAARVSILKKLLDAAERADFSFEADGRMLHLRLDLRHRTAHESTGLLRTRGMAGNLPSGEAYIVPYEGELAQDPTLSNGEIPVQFGDEVVIYTVRENVAVGVTTEGPASAAEALKLRSEPAYGNLAEFGCGVLADFGVTPIGEVLLDEKLGLHIAFGRSDHFGGQVGPRNFSSPDKVVHIDRVYIPTLQPRIRVSRVVLRMANGEDVLLMEDGRYAVAFEEK